MNISIFRCISNCKKKIISSMPLKYKVAITDTAPVTVTWNLYRKEPVGSAETLNLTEYVKTGRHTKISMSFIGLNINK